MAKKFGLGGGVNALFKTEQKSENVVADKFELISNKEEKQENAQVIVEKDTKSLPNGVTIDEFGQLFVDINLLVANPHQPREEFDEEKLNELADSIREHGVLQPITIEDSGDGKFYIIAGERRTRASKIAGLQKIPVQIKKFDDQKKLEIALIENIQRDDLNALEEAKAYYKLMQISGLNQDQVAARVGKNRSTVANAVRLLKLPEDMQIALSEQKLTSGHARALLSVKDSNHRRELFTKIIDTQISVREAEKLANSFNDENVSQIKKQKSSIKPVIDPNLSEIEQKFIEILGTKVVLNGTLEKGKIEIDYFSKADLDRIYNLVNKN